MVDRVDYVLGIYDTAAEAHEAYLEAKQAALEGGRTGVLPALRVSSGSSTSTRDS